jgi:DNA-binding Lrp family transcriptional regulator
MDSYDWKMLAALQSDGRLTNQEIAARVSAHLELHAQSDGRCSA